jgi:Protein of unknown function (DUF3606)
LIILSMLPRPYHDWRLDMADDKSKPGGQDRARINDNEDYELRDWSKKFGATADQLKAGVKAVGTNAQAVQTHLKSRAK